MANKTAVSDIMVTTKSESFFIEAKQCPAQCGQFVLLPLKIKVDFYKTKMLVSTTFRLS